MAKKKESSYKTWEEVNSDLKRLAELQSEKEKLDCLVTKTTNNIVESYEPRSKKLIADIEEIENNIKQFALERKEEFAQKRSKKLNFGTISFKVSKKINIPDKETSIKTLESLNLNDYITIKKDLEKKALEKLDETMLAKAGIRVERVDNITIKPNFIELLNAEGV